MIETDEQRENRKVWDTAQSILNTGGPVFGMKVASSLVYESLRAPKKAHWRLLAAHDLIRGWLKERPT